MGQLHSLRDAAYFPGWLCAIARNRATDFYRRLRPADELPDALPGKGRPDEAEARAALEAIRELPEAYRDTLILRLVEGLSGQEIADRTGLTCGSVRVNLHRGMKLLREKLGRTES
jgi:RNA polymerase sigma-70 factor (ECF subfamily)